MYSPAGTNVYRVWGDVVGVWGSLVHRMGFNAFARWFECLWIKRLAVWGNRVSTGLKVARSCS